MARLAALDLADFCRALRHSLGAGLPLVKVMTQQTERGRPNVRALAGRLAGRLREGSSLGDALEPEAERLPPLFVALVRVGEETGRLPEVFHELERYYQLEGQLKRQLIGQSIMPVLQFFFAVFLVAGLIWLLHALSGKPMLTVYGLSGAAGSFAFLGTVFGGLSVLVVTYVMLTRYARQQALVESVLMRLPAVGPCLQTMALSRISMALALTLDSGLSITRAVRLSFEAAGFARYRAGLGPVVRALKQGDGLTESLTASDLFPPLFLDLVATGEEGGRVPEMMRHQAGVLREEMTQRLTTLARALGGLVWLLSAVFIIWMIFRLAGVYLSALKL